MGTGLPYMAASALYRMMTPPFVLGGMMMLVGYLRSMLTGQERYGDPAFRRFLRNYQWQCLLKGKRQATQSLNERQAREWFVHHGKGASASNGRLTSA